VEVSGQLHAPAALPPAPTGLKARWAPEPTWTRWQRKKSLPLFDNQTPVQFVA